MVRGTPFEEELLSFQVDLLEETVVDVAFFFCVDIVSGEVCGDTVVDGEESCILWCNDEFVKVA